MDNRATGRKGEKRFSLLCSESGVTCNQSVEDDNGWDMLIEFPAPDQPLIALDMRAGVTAASVQVKATETDSRSVSIRLTNALHYARAPLATFIVLVVIEKRSYRYFARHVWTPMIAAWLKAAREADAAGVAAPNQEYLTLRFDAADERGEDILDWMQAEIQAVGRDYSAVKAAIVDTIGFEKSRGTATIQIAIDGPGDLIDIQLGLKSNLHAKRFTFVSERFGIAAGRPEVDLTDVAIVMTPEGEDVILRLQFQGGVSIAVPGKAYRAAHGDKSAIRIVTRCFEWVDGPEGRVQVRAELSTEEILPIAEIALFAHLKAQAAGTPIAMEVELRGRLYAMGSVSIARDDERKTAWGWSALTFSTLLAIEKFLPAPFPELSHSDVYRDEGGPSILSAVASGRYLRFEFFPRPMTPARFDAFIGYGYAQVGDQIVGVVARRPIVDDRREGKRRLVGLGPAQILRCLAVDAAIWSEADIKGVYERQLELMEGEGEILSAGDMVAIANQERAARPKRLRIAETARPAKRGKKGQ